MARMRLAGCGRAATASSRLRARKVFEVVSGFRRQHGEAQESYLKVFAQRLGRFISRESEFYIPALLIELVSNAIKQLL